MFDGRIILLDADVIIHFIRGWQLDILPTIYESEYWILDKVYDELFGLGFNERVDSLIADHSNVFKKALPMELAVIKEYSQLERIFGKGESAVMSMACAYNEVVASSNITDVESYCTKKQLDWITTMDLLAEALARGILSAKNCNDFIERVRESGSNLPNVSIQSYIKGSS